MSTVSYGMICAGRESTVFSFCDSTATTFTDCGEPDEACVGEPACDGDGSEQPAHNRVDTNTRHERSFIASPPANQQNQDPQDQVLGKLEARFAAQSRTPWATPTASLRWQPVARQ